jgi:hypothetical protein
MIKRTEESATPPTGDATGSRCLGDGGHWLLAASPTPGQAAAEWADSGVAWLRPGGLFTAVIVRADVMHQAVGRPGPQECAPLLASELDGPVLYRQTEFGPEGGYTVLLPPSAAGIWRVTGTVVLPQKALLPVPAPDRLDPTEEPPWWVVAPDALGRLCTPALLASLLARLVLAPDGEGRHA